MLRFLAFAVMLTLPLRAAEMAPPTAREIIQRAFKAADANDRLALQYTFHERIEEKFLGKHGKVKHDESKTWDVTLLDGSEYKRLIAKNGEPLGRKEEAREQRKLEKNLAKMRRETEKERRKRRARIEREHAEDRRFIREITRAYDFRLVREETANGVDTYVISATPRADYEPSFRKAKALKKVRGELWIAKGDYGWVKAELETTESFSWGFFLLRLHKGARVHLSQRLVDNEVWLMDNWRVEASGRAGLIAKFRGEFLGSYDNFRKFSTDSSITFGEPVNEPPRRR